MDQTVHINPHVLPPASSHEQIDQVLAQIQRRIILVGFTGSGKSMLANMLTYGELFLNPAAENRHATSSHSSTDGGDIADDKASISTNIGTTGPDNNATKALSGRDWDVIDTPGLSDLQGRGVRCADPAIRVLKEALVQSRKGIHFIGFVVSFKLLHTTILDVDGDHPGGGGGGGGKISDNTQQLFHLYRKAFRGVPQERFVVIVTQCDEQSQDWIENHRDKIEQLFHAAIPVISCETFKYDEAKESAKIGGDGGGGGGGGGGLNNNNNRYSGERKECLAKFEAQLTSLLETRPLQGLQVVEQTTTTGGVATSASVPWLALEDKEQEVWVQEAKSEFEQALGEFLGLGGFIVAVLLNLAKFFRVYQS
ncbi:hypothetical protein BG004_004451 [Podila humilis]|nr:hypothetical protein BG004_004451 [Podila humilis]